MANLNGPSIGQEKRGEDRSHLNARPSGIDVPKASYALRAVREREELARVMRGHLGLLRELQVVLGGTRLAKAIEDGEHALSPEVTP